MASGKADQLIKEALAAGRDALSEHESKLLLAGYGTPVTREMLAGSAEDAVRAAEEIGFPVALKACSHRIKHKTGLGLIKLNLSCADEVRAAYNSVARRAGADIDGILVQEMLAAGRELMAGMVRDATFGPCVVFGLGGVMAEALKDVVFGVAPLEKRDALSMINDIRTKEILGEFRGAAPANSDTLADILIALGRIGIEHPEIREIDINPLILSDTGNPVAADALVVLK